MFSEIFPGGQQLTSCLSKSPTALGPAGTGRSDGHRPAARLDPPRTLVTGYFAVINRHAGWHVPTFQQRM
jgi:hypothetical protein